MNYNDKYELIYYGPMRTASRAIYTILKEIGFVCSTNDYNSHDHSLPSDNDDTCNRDQTKLHYKTICSVRNPYARTVSNYNLYVIHYKDKSLSFEEFIDASIVHQNINYQSFYHEGFKNKQPDYLIRCESIAEDILKIPGIIENYDKLKDEIDRLLKVNAYIGERTVDDNSNDYWKNFYNQTLADIVYENLKEQFDMFGYEKNSWL